MKHIFIVNTNANGGMVASKLLEINNICKFLKIPYEIYPTSNKDDAINIAQMYKNDDAVIYAVGGDGTINAILNAIVFGNAALGIIPWGSGNDFYRTLATYKKPHVTCNVMKVNDQYCLNIFSAGIDAEVCEAANKLNKYNLGSSAYSLGMVYTFFKHRNMPAYITIDNNYYYSDKMTMITVCNGKYYGGGRKIAPNASLESSNALIYILNDMSNIGMLGFLKAIKTGEHEEKYDLTKVIGKNIDIETDSYITANIDGEILIDKRFIIDTSATKIDIVKDNQVLSLIRKK